MYTGTTLEPGFRQTCVPEAASKAVTIPVMPIANSRPLENTGVDFGPGPCGLAALFMVNGAGYAVRHTTLPLSASIALITSSSPCRENRYTRSPTTSGVAYPRPISIFQR